MNRIIYIFIALTVVSLAVNAYLFVDRPKMAYVRSHDLVNNFAGTIQARQDFEKKKSSMLANVDSLRLLFERNKMSFNTSANSMSAGQRNTGIEQLNQQQTQLYQYSNVINDKITEEDSKMMGAVLNQINSFVEDYAQENDLDVIFGTTLSGSLLYGDKALDITDPVLQELNNKYKGK